jgi:hypothetical protein
MYNITLDLSNTTQTDTDHLASLTPQLAALIPPIIDTMKTTKALTLSLHSTFLAMLDQMGASNDSAWRWARASTRPRTTTCSTCPRRFFRTPTSSAAW